MEFDVSLDLRTDHDNEDGLWRYVGTGEVFGLQQATGGSAKVAYSSISPEDIDMPVIDGSNENNSGLAVGGMYYWYPDIVVDGVTYVYEGNPHTSGAKTYRLEWVRFADTGGNNVANGAPDTGNDPGWHLDGYAVLESQVEIKYFVLDADTKQPIDGIGVDGLVRTSLKSTTNGGVAADRLEYSYNQAPYGAGTVTEWYVRKSDGSYEQWDFTKIVTKDLDLYGFLKGPTEEETYTLNLEKVTPQDNAYRGTPESAAGSSIWKTLSGAKFDLYVKEESGEWTKVNEESIVPNNTNGSTATTAYGGLEYGKIYKLIETEAPPGYNKLEVEIYFTAENAESGIYLCDEEGIALTSSSEYASASRTNLIVANYGGYVLPSTGGTGTLMYILSGGMLMMAAGIALVYKQSLRKGARER